MIPSVSRVKSVFGRIGSVVLLSGDVTGALGFTPASDAADVRLAGRAGGQAQYGGTGAGESWACHSTSHPTKGPIILGSGGLVGVNKPSPAAQLHVQAVNNSTVALLLELSSSSPIVNLMELWNNGRTVLKYTLDKDGSITTTGTALVGSFSSIGDATFHTRAATNCKNYFAGGSAAGNYVQLLLGESLSNGAYSQIYRSSVASSDSRVTYFHNSQGDIVMCTDTNGTGLQVYLKNSNGFVGVGRIPTTYQLESAGDVACMVAGGGLLVKEGSNAKMGTVALVGGTATVNTTAVTANSRILLSAQSLGTVAIPSGYGVTARIAGTSFTITASAPTDTSTIAWMIVEPA